MTRTKFVEKLLSIIVPAYNSEAYLERCVNSLIVAGNRVEIILVDDGSLDRTPEIIDEYHERFPEIVKVIHEENSGHGGAINNGLKIATGKYIKVCDSDDWLDFAGLKRLLDFIEVQNENDTELDMILTNYLYDKVNSRHNKLIHFPALPKNKIFGWKQVKLVLGQYFMMHSVTYRRTLLVDEAKLQLPTNVSYDDNIYVFEPLIYVKKMYYLDVNLYHYFIGRDDQSVNEDVMLRKIDQQLMINKRMIKFYADNIDPKTALGKYMRFYLEIITAISSIILIRGKKEQYLDLKRNLWQYLKRKDEPLYHKLKHRPLGMTVNLPGHSGRIVASGFYRVAKAIYGFN